MLAFHSFITSKNDQCFQRAHEPIILIKIKIYLISRNACYDQCYWYEQYVVDVGDIVV